MLTIADREYVGGPRDGDCGSNRIAYPTGQYQPGIWVSRHHPTRAVWYWRPHLEDSTS